MEMYQQLFIFSLFSGTWLLCFNNTDFSFRFLIHDSNYLNALLIRIKNVPGLSQRNIKIQCHTFKENPIKTEEKQSSF